MVSASLKTAVQPASKKKITAQTATTSKPEPSTSKSVAGIMEIDPANVKRDMGSKPIGSGTFGKVVVVVKEYKETVQGGSNQSFREKLSMGHRLLATWGIILGYLF